MDAKAIDHSMHPGQLRSIGAAAAEPLPGTGTKAPAGTQLAAAPAEMTLVLYT